MRISDWSSDVCSSDLLVISLWRRREAFGLDRRTAAWLAFESVACPPHAINLVRKLGLRQPLPGDAMSMATDALDAPALEPLKATLTERTQELAPRPSPHSSPSIPVWPAATGRSPFFSPTRCTRARQIPWTPQKKGK